MQFFVGKELAVVQNFEKGENIDSLVVSIRSTSLFRKESGQWKMIRHHADKLPFLGN